MRGMSRLVATIAALIALLPVPALAQLPVGARAPRFVTATALAGKAGRFSLKAALANGPVVLYFYPKAFTKGCTLEAHAFAEASADFAAAGATILGMSVDDLETLKRFSSEECRDKFAVGVAPPAIVKAYGVALQREGLPSGLTDRTSYVIARNGRVVLVHSDLDYRDHVRLTLEAVRKLKR